MRLRILLGTLAALTLASGGAQAQILNASFETPVIAPGTITIVAAGQNTIANWTVVGTDVLLVQTTYAEPGNGVNGFNAQQGLNSVDLTGTGNTGLANGIQQVINTVIGQAYTLTFWVGRATGNAPFYNSPATVDVSINGGPRTSYTNNGTAPGAVNWAARSHTFVATSTSTTVAFLNGTPPQTAFAGIDNISITAGVPEPGTITLAAVGLPFLAFAAWRRRRSA